MSSRKQIIQTVSTAEPMGAALGDEWFNPTTNKLFKRMFYSGVVGWTEIPLTVNSATSISFAGGAANQILVQTASSQTGFINAPITSDTFLRWNGASFEWSGIVASNIAGGATGSIPYQTAAGTTSFIGIGSNGQVLTSNGTTATWSAPTSPTVQTVAQTANASYFLTFVDTNNAVATSENVFTTSSFVINPGTGSVGIGTASPFGKLDITGEQLWLRGYGISINPYFRAARYLGTSAAPTIVTTGTILGGYDFLGYDGATPFSGAVINAVVAGGVATNSMPASLVFSTNPGTTFTTERMRINSSGTVQILSTATAISTTTGALQVVGGVGIGGNLYVGGEIVAQKLTIQLTTVTTTLIETDDIIRTLNTTQATSTNSGALQVSGGAGIGGNLYVGGTIFGNVNATVNTATNSNNIATVLRTTNAAHYLTFVPDNNASAAYEALYTTASIVVNPGTGNVGIGLASPSYALHVKGTNTITTVHVIGGGVTTAPTPSGTLTVDTLSNGVARTGLDISFTDGAAGRIGGFKFSDTQTPGDWVACQMEMLQSFGAANEIVSKLQIEDATWAGMRFVSQTNAGAALATSPTFIWRNYTTEQMRIDSSGNIGIGTTTATSRLTVSGDARISGITTITNATAASSTTTGALQVIGGVGIGGNLYVGGAIFGTFNGSVTTATNIAGGTAGQLVYQSSTGTTAFAGPGSAGQLLQSNGTSAPSYVNTTSVFVGNATNAVNATNISGGATGQLHIQSGIGNTAFVSTGTNGQVLTWSGSTATWGTAGVSTTATNLAGGTAGQVPYQTGPGVTAFYGPGTAGQLLQSNGTSAPSYVNTTAVYVGFAATASTVLAVQRTTSATHYITFVDANNTTATGDIVYTTASLVVNPGTGNIGIGTSAPTSLLHVAGNTLITGIATVNNTTAATSTSTGALQVAGGAGIGGNLWATQLRQTSPNIAIGDSAGASTQGLNAIAIGYAAGNISQSTYGVAIGYGAGLTSQGIYGLAAGSSAGAINQGQYAVALGPLAAYGTQSNYAVALGFQAGYTNQGARSIAIGYQAGYTQAANSIALNASDAALTASNANSFYVAPIRADATSSATSWGLYYNPTTKEITTASIAASNASNVNTVAQTSTATHYLTFVDSNNASATAEALYTTSSFTINPSTGNVGIGTTSPTGKLDVVGTGGTVRISTTGASINFTNNGVNYFTANAASASIYHESNTHVFRNAAGIETYLGLTSSGVAVGRTTSVKKFDVVGDALFTATSVPTGDIVTISNQGFPVATAGVSALQVNYVGGNGAIEASAIRADMTPGTTSSSIWNAFRVAATSSATTGVTFNGVKFDSKAAGPGTSNALWVGTGYDNIVNYNGTTVINGTGQVVGGQVTGAVGSATNIAGGAVGSIPYQSAANTTLFIPIGSNGQVLTSNGTTATWAAAPGGSTVQTTAQTANASYFLTFVDSNNASATAENVYTTSSFVINPSTGAVGINGAPAGVNGKLQVTGDIGLTGNATIRQSTNSDGNTLKIYATQFVGSSVNSNSYGYTGGAIIGSVDANDSMLLLDVGRASSTDARFKISNSTNAQATLSFGTSTLTTLYADTAGKVGIGTSSPNYLLTVRGGDASVVKNIASTASPILYLNKGRGTDATPANISSGDNLGAVWFSGYSGSGNNGGYGYGAYIQGEADAAVTATTVPGRLTFGTTVAGGSTPTERMRIDSSGNIGVNIAGASTRFHVRTTTTGTEGLLIDTAVGNNASVRIVPSLSAGNYNSITQLSDAGIIYSAGTIGSGALVIAPWNGATLGNGIRMDNTGTVRVLGLNASSTNTGALQVIGGAGIGGNLYVGGTIFGTLSGTISTATNVAGGTAGQLVYQSAPGTTAFAGPGTAGQLLQSNGTSAPSYVNTSSVFVGNAASAVNATNATNATNVAGGAAGRILIQSGAGATTFIPTGTAGQLLQAGSNTATFVNTSSLAVAVSGVTTNIAGGAAGSIPYQSAANTTLFIPIGTNGQVLTSNGTTATWAAAPASSTVQTAARTTNANHFIAFVDSNNAAATAENVYTTSTFTINPSTGAASIGGSLTVSANNVSGGGLILSDDGDIVDLNDGYASFRFSSGIRIYSANKSGTAVATINNSGDIYGNLIHAQTPNSSTTGGLRLMTNGTSGYGYIQIINTAANTEYGYLRFDQAATEEMYWSGKITAADNITAYSDAKIKTNVEPIENAVEKVKQIRGVTFTRTDTDTPDRKYAGVIAQEVEQVLPEVVEENSDGIKTVAYGNMVSLLIEAVKEQQKQIEHQSQKISTLEALVNSQIKN